MRRLLAISATAALVLAGPMPSASADQTVVLSALVPGAQGASTCLYGATANPLAPEADASVRPELGSQSWRVDPAGVSGELYSVLGQGSDSSILDTFRIRILAPNGAEGRALAITVPPGTTSGSYWYGIATITAPPDDFWQWVDAEGMTLFWFEYDADGPTGASRTPATLADFTTQYGEGPGIAGALGFGCDGKAFNIDAFRYGASGDITTTDLEGAHPTLGMNGPATTTAGQSIQLTGSILATDADTDGLGMQLQAKPYGSSAWGNVGSLVPLSGPNFAASVAPTKQTSYRWHFIGSGLLVETYSAVRTVSVRTALTANVADKTLHVGQSLTLTGKTTPAKPGTVVTLFRKVGTKSIKLATSQVAANGTYTLSAKVTAKGTWSVYASVPAASGNLAGQSPVRSASVS